MQGPDRSMDRRRLARRSTVGTQQHRQHIAAAAAAAAAAAGAAGAGGGALAVAL